MSSHMALGCKAAVTLRVSERGNFEDTVPVNQGGQHHEDMKDLMALKLKGKVNTMVETI